jgi:hypothetical protein
MEGVDRVLFEGIITEVLRYWGNPWYTSTKIAINLSNIWTRYFTNTNQDTYRCTNLPFVFVVTDSVNNQTRASCRNTNSFQKPLKSFLFTFSLLPLLSDLFYCILLSLNATSRLDWAGRRLSSPVSKVPSLWAERLGFYSRQGQRNDFFHHHAKTGVGAHRASYPMSTGKSLS